MRKIIFSFLLLSAVSAFCDDPERGRLPDGRAFRTDTQGNQLVDYIAELELNVESLKRRVNGLEDEVTSKNQIIERLNNGKPAQGTLEERDIVRAASSKPAITKESGAEDSFAQNRDAGSARYEVERRAQADQILSLKTQLAKVGQELESRDQELLVLKSGSNQAIRAQEDKRAKLQEILESKQADAELEIQRKSKEIDALKAQLDELRVALKNRDEALAQTQMELKDVRAELTTSKSDASLAKAVSEVKPVEVVKVEERKKEIEISQPEERDSERSERASFSPARSRAVESVRGSLTTELNKLGALISTRDRLLEQYNSQRRALVIKPSAAFSSKCA